MDSSQNSARPAGDGRSDCTTCRHHSKKLVPRPLQEVVVEAADFVGAAFSDEDEPQYTCRAPPGPSAPHTGQIVGFVPITCAAYEPGKKSLATLNAAYARYEERRASTTSAVSDD